MLYNSSLFLIFQKTTSFRTQGIIHVNFKINFSNVSFWELTRNLQNVLNLVRILCTFNHQIL
jgi:hypothetical protein